MFCRPTIRVLPLLLVALLFAACDSEPSEDPEAVQPVDLGAFNARVSFDDGDRLDLSGFALASTAPIFTYDSLFVPGDSLAVPDSATAFQISLSSLDPVQPPEAQTVRTISLARFDSGRPEPGTYRLGSLDRSAFHAFFASFDRSGGGGSTLNAEAGSLTIDVSTDVRISGSFTFIGSYAPLEGGTPRTATVTGRFDARFSSFDAPFVPLP